MDKAITNEEYNTIIIGGGCAGIASAIAAAKNGAKILLIESGPFLGGELISGLPIDGCLNARGEWIVGGIIKEIFDECAKRKGYIGPVCDFRALWVVCIDPIIMQFAIIDVLKRYSIDILLYSFADGVEIDNNKIRGIYVTNKLGRTFYSAKIFIDCTGDGDIAVKSGASFEQGGSNLEDLQPVSIVYRMENVDSEKLLKFVIDNLDNVSLGESEYIANGKSKKELAESLIKQGLPKVFFIGDGPLLSSAIEDGLIEPCSMLAITPNSILRKAVSINSTRIVVDAQKTNDLSKAIYILYNQIDQGVNFLINRVPGFENSKFAGIAPRIGIRETRRIIGDYILTREDVLGAKKCYDGVAKGGHEIDIHGKGKEHTRLQLKDGGSYDIPYGCLIPKGILNLFIAGRIISSTREAHSSARVMGTCMAMGQAVGTAASICVKNNLLPREVNVSILRSILMEQGAILNGTY